MNDSWENLIAGVKNRDIRAAARLITRVENRAPGWKEAMSRIYSRTGSARVIGITGSPGAGKSTLTCAMTKELISRGLTVGIIAIDPSSPFSGGALLGDRLRMKEIFETPGVFIRSMATRGMLGGLCQAARDVVRILDLFGKDIILVETVGVGQDEIEVVKTADLVMVVCMPGQGDGIQAIKAGVMEIADLYVVNKADMPGVDEAVADILAMLELSTETGKPSAPVLKTSALKNQGVKEVVTAFLDHRTDEDRRQAKAEIRAREEILSLLAQEVSGYILKQWENENRFCESVNQVLKKQKDPYAIVKEMTQRFNWS